MFLDFKFFDEYFPKYKAFTKVHPIIGFIFDITTGFFLVAAQVALGVGLAHILGV